MRKIKRYGWKPDRPDFRDHRYHLTLKPKETKVLMAATVDLRYAMPNEILDQGNLGSCTSNAAVVAFERSRRLHGLPFHQLSRLFLYYNSRAAEGDVLDDAGASLRDTVASCAKDGVCAEKVWTYDINKFSVLPPPQTYALAKRWKIARYVRLTTEDDMAVCLNSRHPFVFGFSVYESFESQQVENTGIVPMPKPNESLLGGHAVCAVGINTTRKDWKDLPKRTLLCRNSWGRSWAAAGYFYLPLDYALDPNLADDLWTVRL